MEDLITRPLWKKSSYSGSDGGHCVELARLTGAVGVRDSKDPHGPKLLVTRNEFAALLTALGR
ncbi:DUF397 domain-containing protein [Actinomadura chokoriensis]|uniref:DUF397 domain-containing protein n=1 Tax=Actinomadura chokoriensis TaxID=454156 RepID=A0ABV4QWF5_9ACTN